MQVTRGRSLIVLEEVSEIVNRLGGGGRTTISGEYEKMMEIRKGLFLIETRIIKQA